MPLKSISVLSESHVYLFLITWNLVHHGVLCNLIILLIQRLANESPAMVRQGREAEQVERKQLLLTRKDLCPF